MLSGDVLIRKRKLFGKFEFVAGRQHKRSVQNCRHTQKRRSLIRPHYCSFPPHSLIMHKLSTKEKKKQFFATKQDWKFARNKRLNCTLLQTKFFDHNFLIFWRIYHLLNNLYTVYRWDLFTQKDFVAFSRLHLDVNRASNSDFSTRGLWLLGCFFGWFFSFACSIFRSIFSSLSLIRSFLLQRIMASVFL